MNTVLRNILLIGAIIMLVGGIITLFYPWASYSQHKFFSNFGGILLACAVLILIILGLIARMWRLIAGIFISLIVGAIALLISLKISCNLSIVNCGVGESVAALLWGLGVFVAGLIMSIIWHKKSRKK